MQYLCFAFFCLTIGTIIYPWINAPCVISRCVFVCSVTCCVFGVNPQMLVFMNACTLSMQAVDGRWMWWMWAPRRAPRWAWLSLSATMKHRRQSGTNCSTSSASSSATPSLRTLLRGQLWYSGSVLQGRGRTVAAGQCCNQKIIVLEGEILDIFVPVRHWIFWL